MDQKIIDLITRPGIRTMELVGAMAVGVPQIAAMLATSDRQVQISAMQCVTWIVCIFIFSRSVVKFAAALATPTATKLGLNPKPIPERQINDDNS